MPSCSACGAPRRSNTTFCAACGAQQRLRRPLPYQPSSAPGAHARTAVGLYHLKSALGLWLSLLGTLIVGALLSQAFEFPGTWVEVWLTLLCIAIVLGFGWRERTTLTPLLIRTPLIAKDLGYVLAAGAGCWVVMGLYFGLLQSIGVEPIRMSEDYTAAGWSVGSMILLISVAPAVTEELAFRGLIQHHLQKLMNQRDAWLVQAMMFSVLHLGPLMFPSHFFMGLALGWVRLRTGNLYASILLHMLWNLGVLVEELRA